MPVCVAQWREGPGSIPGAATQAVILLGSAKWVAVSIQ